jgi:hypothetical protein
MPKLNLLDVTKNQFGIGAPIVDEASKNHPEVAILPVDTLSTTTAKLTVRSGNGTASFRNFNEGVAPQKATYVTRTFELAAIDHPVEVDILLYNAAEDKARLMISETQAGLEAVFELISKSVWYGKDATIGGGAKGFEGLVTQRNTDLDVDATGTSAKSSVFFIYADVSNGVSLLLGNKAPLTWGDPVEETIRDTDGNSYRAMTNRISGFVGVRLANKKNLVRIKNIGTAAGKTLTDTLLYKAYEKFTTDNAYRPSHAFATARSIEQLRSSRTATTADGAPAPLPVSVINGIPLVTTSAISNDEGTV